MDLEFLQVTYILISVALAATLLASCFRRSRLIVRKILRWLFYSNSIARLLRNDILLNYVPGVVALYYISIDLWKDEWAFFTDHIETHENIFLFLAGTSLLLVLVRAVSEQYEKSGKAKISRFQKAFVQFSSKIVGIKLERFKSKAVHITPSGNTFRQITQSEDQINLILNELVDLLDEQLGITEGEQCISIIRRVPNTEKWYFPYVTNKNWRHTRPSKLLTENSAAKKCLEIGEPLFYVDKDEAARSGFYYTSERDKRKGVGSVFCYPVITQTKDYTDSCVISVVTYGKMLCDPIDAEHAEAIKLLLCDVCKRLDLELTLEAIKFWQFEFNQFRDGK